MRPIHVLICAATLTLGCGSGDGTAPRASHTESPSTSGTGGTGGAEPTGPGGAGGAGGVDACEELADALQQAVDEGRASAGSPGAVMAVLTPDCGLWEGASGNSTDAVPMSPSNVLRIGSVTKTFVATTILELASEHVLALDDALETWISGFPGGDGITLRQLLDHTSGIYNYTDDPAFWDIENPHPTTAWTPAELVEFAAAQPAYFAPGEGWHYSNTNYVLLGMIVEGATGHPVGEEIRARLLDPQKLSSTSFEGEEPIVGDLAHGFTKKKLDVTSYFDPSYAWAAGAMVASAGDLARWANALYGGAVLDQASLDEMMTTVDTDQAGFHYGLGVFELDPSVALVHTWGHMGDIPGYHTHMFYLEEQKTALVSIVNSDAASPNDITVAGLELLVGR